jgi:hypothetical protein
MRRPLLLLVPLAAALAGCGTASSAGKFSGAQGDVAKQVEALQTAGQSHDGDKACSDILSRSLRDAMNAAGSTCAEQVSTAMKDADDFELDVRAVSITGPRATARVRARIGGRDQIRTMQLVRESGSWRISSLG